MRITYVINSVEAGGAALPVPNIVGVLRAAGADVRVLALTRRDGRALPAMLDAGLDVVVRDGGERDHTAALRWLDRQVVRWRPTHIWTSLTRATLLGQLVGQRRRVPVVSWQHAAYLKPGNLRALRATQRLSRLWIGDSEPITRMTGERLGVSADRLVTWPIFRADLAAPQAKPWQPGEPVRVGSLGRLHRVKGYDVLVQALARLPGDLPPLEVAVAGDGAQREALVRDAVALGVGTFALVGYTADPAEWLAGNHLYVQPSRSEGLCVAAHQAMAAGLPVLASAVGALPTSILDGRTGMLVPPGNPDTLAQALATLVAWPDRLAEMGATARARVLDLYGPDTFAKAGAAVLARLATI